MIDVDPLILCELERMHPLPDGSRADWSDVLRRAGSRTRISRSAHLRRLTPRRRLALALVVAVALALPALALSGVLDSLLGFSNKGTPGPHPLATTHVLGRSAKPGSFVKLASREGITVYAAHHKGGGFCFYWSVKPYPKIESGGGSCLAPANFPSPSIPVWDMSSIEGQPPFAVKDLIGVAADGVRSVQVLADDCRPVATAPVIDNVYIARLKPMAPRVGLIFGESYFVARDASGHVIWHRKVFPWHKLAFGPGKAPQCAFP